METSTNRGMTGSNAHMQEEIESLRSGFGKLRSDVAELFTHAFGLGKSGAEYAREHGGDTVEQLKHRYADFRRRGADQMTMVEHRIEENPLSSAMIAFGVGFVIARFMHRRR